MYLIFK